MGFCIFLSFFQRSDKMVIKQKPIHATTASGNQDVKSAARALDIMEYLTSAPNGRSLTDIGKSLRIPLSSLHGLVTTMLNRGYLVRNDSTLLITLGPRITQIAALVHNQFDLIPLADPIMRKLRNELRETTSLAILDGTLIVFIHKCPMDGRIQVVNPVGTRLPAHATGSGKVLLSFLPEEEIDYLYPDEILPARTPRTITSKGELKIALKEIRENGFAYDDQESDREIWAVASCIRNDKGYPVAAISVVAPIFRIREKDHKLWYKYVRDGALEVSKKLGFRPN